MPRPYVLRGKRLEMASTVSKAASGGSSVLSSVAKGAEMAFATRRGLGLVNCSISQRHFTSDYPKSSPDSPPPLTADVVKNQRRAWLQGLSRVVGFKVYRRDIVPIRKAWKVNPPIEPGERGEISELSTKSQRRLALIASNSPVDFASLITLTYPKDFPADGKIVKRHLNAMLTRLREWFPEMQYLWVLEFQRRGAPHFHIFSDIELPAPLQPMKRASGRVRKEVRVNWGLQDKISERWYEIVGSGDEKHRRCGAAWEVLEKRDGCARYIAKEAYKTFQKKVPIEYGNVGRFWGCSRGVTPAEPETIDASLAELAAFLPPESFGEEGEPFPIVFGAADAYKKIIGTKADPAILREWLHGSRQKILLPKKLLDGAKSTRPIKFHEE